MDLFYDSLGTVLTQSSQRVLITNAIYYDRFYRWNEKRGAALEVISNGIKNKNKKIGAIGDLLLAIKKKHIDEDVLVVAPDFILPNFNFNKFIKFAQAKNSSATLYRNEKDLNKIQAGSCIALDKNQKITRFAEKPAVPFSHFYGIPYYLIKKNDLQYLEKIPLVSRDNSGQIVAQLVKYSKVYALRYNGKVIHLTSEQDYQELKKERRGEASA